MTKRAAYFILATVAVLLVALSTGARVYYLLVCAMTMMLVLGVSSALLALLTAKARIKCPRRSVERGASIPVTVTVRHLSVLPVKAITLKLSLPDDAGAVDEIEIGALPFLTQVYDFKITCPHRGIYRVGLERISVTDIFGLVKFERKAERYSFEVEALPLVTQLEPISISSRTIAESQIVRMTEDYASPSDIRSWRSGDALKKVHWKLSMRKRELIVRTYEESARPDTLVLIDLYPVGSFKSHALTTEDAVIETAASIINAQLNADYPVRMPLMCSRPTEISGDSPANMNSFIRELAHVKFDSPYQFEKVIMLEM
ncbi:MAG: DUF58 domain-containing protein, partial [Clostridia bacterium]|nr:DUF58 domain-containing protein [Clostridia bacterium]